VSRRKRTPTRPARAGSCTTTISSWKMFRKGDKIMKGGAYLQMIEDAVNEDRRSTSKGTGFLL
jgi:hypothetical protein